MRIAIDISPLSTGHKVRGTGFYVFHLKNALEKYFPEHTYTFFTDKKDIPRNADIIHYPYFDPFSLTVPLGHAKKTVVTVLDLTPIVFPKAFPAGIKGNAKWQLQRLALKKIGGILTDSKASGKDIKRLVGVSDNKIGLAYLAAGEEFHVIKDKTKIKKLRETYNLPEKFILYVGDVTWNKNVPRIIESAIQSGVPLVMAGKALVNENFDRNNIWNADLIKAQEFAKKHTDIIRLGFIPDEDLVTLYNAATIFLFPSLYEGFGLPVLEAMACGCPVITSKEASLPEVAEDAACFVNAYDTNSIASGIENVCNSVTLQRELSQKGLEQVQKFSWKKTAEETLAFYKKVLQEK